nr:MAG: protein of unknown function DUF4884 [Bacteriophage sp.]
MKKIIIISIALLALTACESKQVEEVKASSNQSYPVEKLFTVDGITVYRDTVTMTVTFTSQTERAMFNTVIKRGLEKQQKMSRFKQCVTTMGRKINIEEVRGFLEASNRQFEQGGIYLERALFKRDDNGVLTGITLSYEDRTTSDTQETRKEKQV